jgi:hypothetical protein
MTGMSGVEVDALVRAVQANCHIADARHASDLSLCIYLLQMREFYRWERGLPFGASLERTSVGQWLAQREALWAGVEGQAYETLLIGGAEIDPMDTEAVNAALASTDLVYGAGLAGAERPLFFLAQRHSMQRRDGLQLLMCGRELARGVLAPPAVLTGEPSIVLRRESLARWLWEKYEAFSLRQADGPFKSLIEGYALHDAAAFVAALPRLVDELCDVLVLHELGEHRAGQWLGPAWAAMRLDLGHRRTELSVRAVRDHLADLEVTLPTLIERGATAPLHFWFANYDGLRERLFPSLPEAYAAWTRGDAGDALTRAARSGAAHFRALAQQILDLHARFGSAAGPHIDRLLAAPEATAGRGDRGDAGLLS